MDVVTEHQLKIAKDTLRLSSIGTTIMGGMTKEEARQFLKDHGWSSKKIQRWETEHKR